MKFFKVAIDLTFLQFMYSGDFTLIFIIPRIVLLSFIQPEAETLDFSTHALPRNLLKIFPPHEHKQRQALPSNLVMMSRVVDLKRF